MLTQKAELDEWHQVPKEKQIKITKKFRAKKWKE